jgi:hypothetical protein
MTGAQGVTDPAVQALISAINRGDRAAFFRALTPDATMSDDGTDRDLADWADREIFSANGQLEVVSATGGGRSMIAAYRNDTWGEMRTRWAFTGLRTRARRGDWPAPGALTRRSYLRSGVALACCRAAV